jgi:hypothetical protein
VSRRIDLRAGRHISRLACPNDSLTCPDRPRFKLAGRVFSPHFSLLLLTHTKTSPLSPRACTQTLDLCILMLSNSNLTPETRFLTRNHCFHRLIWGKSTNPSFVYVLCESLEFELNPSNFFRYLVFCGFLNDFQVSGFIVVWEIKVRPKNPRFCKCSKLWFCRYP